MDEILHIEHLEKHFGDHIVLRDIDLTVHRGEVISIIGPSGSGKSTLLRCINYLEEPTGGRILYEGKDVSNKEMRLSEYRAKVGMVFQQFNLFGNMNVLANCVCPQTTVLTRPRAEAEKIAKEYLAKVGMAAYMNARPAQLSGGQKQRVAIARSLSMHPEVILFDEPTSALDPQLTGEVLEVMKKLAEEGYLVIQSTHNPEHAFLFADQTLALLEGKVAGLGTPQEVLTEELLERMYGIPLKLYEVGKENARVCIPKIV